jgi:multicomponent Na+:H+ antiporter subunit A
MEQKLSLPVLVLALAGTGMASTSGSHPAPEPSTILLAVFLPFVASSVFFVAWRYLKDFAGYLGASVSAICFLSVLSLYSSHGAVSMEWIPSLGIAAEFYIDGLSLLVGSLASGIGTLVFLYSQSYMEHEPGKRRYYSIMLAFMGSMIGLAFASDLVMLFVFWEATSVCSYLLISHYRDESSFFAARKSLLITVGSGLMLLACIVVLNSVLGTFSLAEILSNPEESFSLLKSSGMHIPVLFLLLFGAGAKSAQIPLHIWLPDAMEAPTPVSAFLHSATMVKAGAYLLGRFRPVLMQGEAWNILLLTVGLVTMTVAAGVAVASSDIKKLLAYSTASHLGLIVAGLGFGSVLGAETGGLHILNHAVFKASLFMVAGIVSHSAGTRDMRKLSGLNNTLPVTAVAATLAGLSMAGFPLLNGFFSKELLYESALHLAEHSGGLYWILPVIAIGGSVFTFLYSMKLISIFYGDESDTDIHRPSLSMVAPPALLATLALLLGLAPELLAFLGENAVHSVSSEAHDFSLHFALSPAFGMSVVTYLAGGLLFMRIKEIEAVIQRLTSTEVLTPTYWYVQMLRTGRVMDRKLSGTLDRHHLRTWVIWLVLPASAWILISSGVNIPEMGLPLGLPGVVVLATAVVGALASAKAETYISSVLTLSILGFMVAIYYLLANAPDLTLTQLTVETLSLVIFLLVLNHLPDLGEKVSDPKRFRDLAVSLSAGFMIFLAVGASTLESTPDRLSSFFVEHALPGSGGSNVVNVILVDFRGLDTMGEISVIAMAGLAILMLFERRGEK